MAGAEVDAGTGDWVVGSTAMDEVAGLISGIEELETRLKLALGEQGVLVLTGVDVDEGVMVDVGVGVGVGVGVEVGGGV